MSNPDFRFGLSPIGHISGAAWNGATQKCYIPVGTSAALFIGDPVVLTGSADTSGIYPTIDIATAGNTHPIAGVITSFEPVSPTFGATPNLNLQIMYCPAATAMYCNVCFDPTVLYAIQGDTVATIAYTDVGSCFDLIATHTGDTVTGLSGWELNSSAKTTSASTYQVRLWGASPSPTNDIASVNARWIVSINLNQLFSAGVNTAGTAVAGGVGV
jgi:hypothetical protein